MSSEVEAVAVGNSVFSKKERDQAEYYSKHADKLINELEKLAESNETEKTGPGPKLVTTFPDGKGIPQVTQQTNAYHESFHLPLTLDQLPGQETIQEQIQDRHWNLNKQFQQLRAAVPAKEQQWSYGLSHLAYSVPMTASSVGLRPSKSSMILNPGDVAYEEHNIDSERQLSGEGGKKSSSLQRKAEHIQDYARGKIGNVPFRAGGSNIADVPAPAPPIELDDSLQDAEIQRIHSLITDMTKDKNDPAFEVEAPGCEKFTRDHIEQSKLNWYHLLDDAIENASGDLDDTPRTKGLLERYKDYSMDRDNLLDIQSIASHSVQRSTSDNAQIFDLLAQNDLDDDLGLYMDDEDDVKEDEIAQTTDDLSASFDKLKSNLIDKPAAEATEEESIEKLLELDVGAASDMVNGGIAKDGDVAKSKVSEWAITEHFDVSNFKELVPNPALSYPFELDTFQKEAIYHIEQSDCVFVAAHTSAGKTVVAEYAIALAQSHMTRTVYTSPIKALSNQKFREFRLKFGADMVGLITGDVSINPEAPCLVMTTEILRSMLYRGADIIRDIEWVVFDEIHYINDSERGVVWEEVIIMLPQHIGMIFLSATTPNTYEFSDWIGRTKKKKIHVLSTTKRPVPLHHHLYVQGEMIKIMDQKSGFLAAAHAKAAKKFNDNVSTSSSRGGRGGRSGGRSTTAGRGRGQSSGGDKAQWTKLIRTLEAQNLLPVVVFAFSKRLCEQCSSRLSNVDLSTSTERHTIHSFVTKSIQRLQGSDQQLPQVLNVKDMAMRGIGIHHGGLLPILKEMVEILFSRGLIKVLFATETFAMGVNMPARTVVFNGLRKHDGRSFRNLLPGEYTQMAGRAGRRGLDKVGTVLLACWDDVPEANGLNTMLVGQATRLSSQFRLTYTMILNLLRVEDMTVEDMIKRSFSEFHSQKALASKNFPLQLKRVKALLEKLRREFDEETCIKGGEMEIEAYYRFKQESKKAAQYLNEQMVLSKHSSTVLCPGRLLIVQDKGLVETQALVLRVTARSTESAEQTSFLALVLCPPEYKVLDRPVKKSGSRNFDQNFGSLTSSKGIQVGTSGQLYNQNYVILDLNVSNVVVISQEKTNMNVRALVDNNSSAALAEAVEFLCQKKAQYPSPNYPPGIDPRADLRLNGIDIANAVQHLSDNELQRKTSKCDSCPQQAAFYERVDQLYRLEKYSDQLHQALSSNSLSLFPDFMQRLKVLESLGYITADRTVELKGRVACEINTCDELILTELIFENVFASLEPEEIIAILSALIFQDKSAKQDKPTLTPRLEHSKEMVERIASSLAILQLEHQLDIDPIDYIEQLNFGLLEVVYEWARGMPFKEICTLTSVLEGSIVRCITRLDEVCREVRNAAMIIGDPRLYRKMEIASDCIKRDVVFATSLYVS